MPSSTTRLTLFASAAVLAFAASASAQDYGYPNDNDRYGDQYVRHHHHDGYAEASYGGPDEVVTVSVPRHREHSTITGAPIEDIALSQSVRYDDLDLTSDEGVHVLHERIRRTAEQLCRRLDATAPPAVSDSPPCYREAVDEAMEQADDAIDAARDGEE
jgi:UrcA family protein